MDKNEFEANDLIDIRAMDKAQERDIFTAIRHGDTQMRERLAQSSMAVVSEMADKCASSQVGFGELLSEGMATLFAAIDNFNCHEDESFIAHLTQCIEEHVRYLYSNLTWLTPIDGHVVRLHNRYMAALLELYPECDNAEDECVQDEEYVADYLGVPVDELRAMKNEYRMCSIESLDEPVMLDGTVGYDIDHMVPLIETIADPTTDNPAAEYLDGLMECLTDDERFIVCAKNGVISVMERTDEQIAEALGLDIKHMNRLYRCAIAKIKQAGTAIKQKESKS